MRQAEALSAQGLPEPLVEGFQEQPASAPVSRDVLAVVVEALENQSGDRLGAGEIMLFELREEFKVLQADAVRPKR